MSPTFTMTKQEEIIYLIPFLLEDYPKGALTIAFAHQDQERTSTDFGPIASKPLARLDDKWHEDATAMAMEFNATDVFFVAYVQNLSATLEDGHLVRQIHECALTLQNLLDERYQSAERGFVSAFITDYTEWIAVNSTHPHATANEIRTLGLIKTNEELKNSQIAAELAYAGHIVPERDEIPEIPSEDIETAHKAYTKTHSDKRQKRAVQAVFNGTANATDYGIANQAIETPETRDRLLFGALAGLDLDDVWTMSVDELEAGLASTNTSASHILDRARAFDAMAGHQPGNNAPALSCSAYLRWWDGKTTSAYQRATEALTALPNYPLAQLVVHAIDVDVESPAQQ